MAAKCEARLREPEVEVHSTGSVVASSCDDTYVLQLTDESPEEDLPDRVELDSTNVTGWSDSW